MDGYEWRREQHERDMALLQVNIINSLGTRKKPVTVDDILGKKKKLQVKEDRRTAEERRRELANLKRTFKAK